LFGSCARGEANGQSDLDFLIDEGQIRGLSQYTGFVLDPEDCFGCNVDVVMDGIKDKAFPSQIRKDAVVLFEAG
jgi:predicted nucleotidyltransferase